MKNEELKVIIVGLGKDFTLFAKTLQNNFEIVAYTDNLDKSKDAGIKEKYINIDSIGDVECDKIIICTRLYYETLKYQLIYKYKIDEKKIYPIQFCVEEFCEGENTVFSSVEKFKKLSEGNTFSFKEKDMRLICYNYYETAGSLAEHYFAQDIWGAQKILHNKPDKHYDVGSRLDGFIGHLLVFMEEVHYIDIRPLPYKIKGLKFIQADATNMIGIEDNSIESLSSFHAIEHFGLGRYGDPLDPDACFQAMRAFSRVLQPGGHLYLGVPIGPENKLIFNAHRIFHPQTIIDNMSELRLIDFAYIGANPLEQLIENVPIDEIDKKTANMAEFSCGLFEFIKDKVNI